MFDFTGAVQHAAQLVTEGAAPEHIVPRVDSQAPERLAQRATLDDQAPERLAQRAASSSSSPEKSVTTSEDARAVRDRQLRDLLSTLGMKGRLTSSSSSATKGVSYDGNPSSESVAVHAAAGPNKPVMLPRNFDIHVTRVMMLEQKIEEMRSEMKKAQQAEQRLRIDRDEWRLMAENLQTPGDANAEEEEEEDDHDEESPFSHLCDKLLFPCLKVLRVSRVKRVKIFANSFVFEHAECLNICA